METPMSRELKGNDEDARQNRSRGLTTAFCYSYEIGNKAVFPSFHHRKEWLRHQKNFAKPQNRRSRGSFPSVLNRKTTPASRSADAAQHFTGRSATPPCGDARRGIIPLRQIREFLHCSYERRFFL